MTHLMAKAARTPWMAERVTISTSWIPRPTRSWMRAARIRSAPRFPSICRTRLLAAAQASKTSPTPVSVRPRLPATAKTIYSLATIRITRSKARAAWIRSRADLVTMSTSWIQPRTRSWMRAARPTWSTPRWISICQAHSLAAATPSKTSPTQAVSQARSPATAKTIRSSATARTIPLRAWAGWTRSRADLVTMST